MPRVEITELRRRLSSWLRRARDGETITVCDGGKSVALLAPAPAGPRRLQIRRKHADAPRPCDLSLPEPLDLRIDAAAELIDERVRERDDATS